jgi:protein required for attachment to host cells
MMHLDGLIQNKRRRTHRDNLFWLRAVRPRSGRSAHRRQVSEIIMGKLKIPHDAIIFVGDGRKALFLRNEGDEKFPNLKTEKVFEHLNPSTHEQGSERPGRVSGSHSGRRSAIEPVDWHDLEERRFTREVAAAAELIIRSGKAKALVVVAPPRTLAELRLAFHPDVKRHILAEFDKDLTKHPVGEIERHLVG